MEERFMRKLFMAIFIPVLIVLGTPALAATIMYDSSGDTEMPTYLYTQDADAKAMLFEELDNSIADVEDGTTTDMEYNLHQDIINTAIYEMLKEQNPDYMPTDDCTDDSCLYVFAEPVPIEDFNLSLRLVGAWVEFEDDRFVFNAFLEVQLNDGFTYKTVMELHFLFKDLPSSYELEFDKIQLGNLPIPKSLISSILNAIDSQLDGVDFQEQADDVQLGEFDVNNLSYSLEKDEILSKLSENSEQDSAQADLAQQVLSIIFDNELVNFDLEQEEFVLTAGVSKFRSEDITDIPSYLYDLHYTETVDGEEVIGEYDPEAFDAAAYLQDKFTEYVFNNALVGGDFIIRERTFNKLIYSGAEGFSDTRTTYEYEDDQGEMKTIEFGLKAIWFELAPEEIYVNVLFRIAGIESLLQITADETSTSGTELVFEFTEITFGKDAGEEDGDYLSILDLDAFKALFADIGDVEFGSFDENGTLTISAESLTALMQDGSQDGAVEVTGISLVQDGIALTITPTSQELIDALNDFTEAVNTVFEDPNLLTDLEAVLDTDTEGPEQDVYQAVVDIQAALTDGDDGTTVSADDVESMFEDFELLDPETQEEFITTFEDLVPQEILDAFESGYTDSGSGE